MTCVCHLSLLSRVDETRDVRLLHIALKTHSSALTRTKIQCSNVQYKNLDSECHVW